MAETEERDRPGEWLRALIEGPRSYVWLVEDSNGLATAAYRLARARCRTRPAGILIPTANELHAAARQIESATEGRATLPALGLLLDECELRGLPVIQPLRAAGFRVSQAHRLEQNQASGARAAARSSSVPARRGDGRRGLHRRPQSR